MSAIDSMEFDHTDGPEDDLPQRHQEPESEEPRKKNGKKVMFAVYGFAALVALAIGYSRMNKPAAEAGESVVLGMNEMQPKVQDAAIASSIPDAANPAAVQSSSAANPVQTTAPAQLAQLAPQANAPAAIAPQASVTVQSAPNAAQLAGGANGVAPVQAAPQTASAMQSQPVMPAAPIPTQKLVEPVNQPVQIGQLGSMSGVAVDDDKARAKVIRQNIKQLQADLRAIEAKSKNVAKVQREKASNSAAPAKAENARPEKLDAVKPKVKSEKAADDARPSARSDYIVTAVVDGRAWVYATSDRANYTLAKGDSLPDGSVVKELEVTETSLVVHTTKGRIMDERKGAR